MSGDYGQPAHPDKERVAVLQNIAHKMRLHIVNMTDAAGSGLVLAAHACLAIPHANQLMQPLQTFFVHHDSIQL